MPEWSRSPLLPGAVRLDNGSGGDLSRHFLIGSYWFAGGWIDGRNRHLLNIAVWKEPRQTDNVRG